MVQCVQSTAQSSAAVCTVLCGIPWKSTIQHGTVKRLSLDAMSLVFNFQVLSHT